MILKYKEDRFETARRIFDYSFNNNTDDNIENYCLKKALTYTLNKNKGIVLKKDNNEYVLWIDDEKDINIISKNDILYMNTNNFIEGNIFNINLVK